jgi:hypothetical protein
MASIITVQINSITARSPINKTFSGDLDEQIIPQSPEYFAGFAAYITLDRFRTRGEHNIASHDVLPAIRCAI